MEIASAVGTLIDIDGPTRNIPDRSLASVPKTIGVVKISFPQGLF